MLLHVVAILAGLLILAVASDVFVVGAARLAALSGVPEVIVGTLVIGFGTGMPELLTSVLAATQGSLGVAVGSVIGSNTVNATLVMGVAALIAAPAVSSRVLRREAPVALAAVLLFASFATTSLIRLQGAILLCAFAGAVVFLAGGAARAQRARPAGLDEQDAQLFHEVELDYVGAGPRRLAIEILRTAGGLGGTLGGAQLLVWGALGIVSSTGANPGVVGLTVVAIGTSLPELVAAIQASRRGRTGLVVGNVLGSNLFNALAVGGAAVLIRPGVLPHDISRFPNLIMALTMVALTVWMYTGRRLHRMEGVAMVLTYFLAVALSFV